MVGDQFGHHLHLDLAARGVAHLVNTDAPAGTYNLTNGGPTMSWAGIAKRVFELRGGMLRTSPR